MTTGARERNSLLALAGMVYFTCVHLRSKLHLFLPKELLVGVLFSLGCALPTFGRGADISAAFIAIFVFFSGLACLNCYAIEIWESVGQTWFSRRIFSTPCALALAGLFVASVLHAAQNRSAELIAAGAASALLLAWLDRIRSRLTPLALRMAADLVLLTPLVVIFR
jgi:hypothetical protein